MGNLSLNASQRRLLGEIFRNPGIKQRDLAAPVGLTQSTVSRLSASFENSGLCNRGRDASEKLRGQPSPNLYIAANYGCGVGLSLAADSWSLSVVDLAGEIRAARLGLPYVDTPYAILDGLRAHLEQLVVEAGFSSSKIIGVGVSISGFRIEGTSRFNTPLSLEDFALLDLEELISNAIQLPTVTDNDGKAAALAEAMIGQGRRFKDFAYIYFASGVGGGVIIDGKLFRGRNGNSGEFGSAQPLLGSDQPASLMRLFQILPVQEREKTTFRAFLDIINVESPVVRSWIDGCRNSLAQMITSASAILDPEAIVFGGLMPQALTSKLVHEVKFIEENRRDIRPMRPLILPSMITSDPACIGAALLPLTQKFYDYI